MSYRRETFINKCAQFLNIARDNIIVINMEKGVFNNAIEMSKKNGNPLKWSAFLQCITLGISKFHNRHNHL